MIPKSSKAMLLTFNLRLFMILDMIFGKIYLIFVSELILKPNLL